jgi:hypothetical protein
MRGGSSPRTRRKRLPQIQVHNPAETLWRLERRPNERRRAPITEPPG